MKKRYLVLLVFLAYDFLATTFSVALSLIISGCPIFLYEMNLSSFSFLMIPASMIFILYIFKIYNILWRYSNITELLRIIFSVIVDLVVFYISSMAVFGKSLTLNFYLCSFFITVLLVIFQRILFKKVYSIYKSNKKYSNKVLQKNTLSGNVMVIGAGNAGQMIINEITRKSEFSKCKVKCVIDDSEYKWGQYISGVKIIGGRESIIKATEDYKINIIIFAIPSCPVDEKTNILNICHNTECILKIVPSICKMYDLDEISPSIRNVEIEDLLGREPINLNTEEKLSYVEDKVILVTGGGGSIGSELCRQIARHNPKQLIVFDIYENNAYEIQNELIRNYPELNLVTLIGSVRDSKRMEYVFKTYSPDIVYHAAAHKHVPLMEDCPNETIKNNIFGTLKTAQCADKYGAQKFVLISTDKAVNPTNIMGASKRICEMIIQTFNNKSDTEFVAVRFGNVLGSNGSVVPLFKNQIKNGGPVTVTHPDIIRYFMTISEAVSLVLQAGANASGGEIFVLDMGKPVKILSLAENLIKLSGFTPYKDIDIKFTSIRPGEKKY